MSYCEDCGTRTSGGICSNCQEELYIGTFQAEYIEEPLSDDFLKRMAEQATYLEKERCES